MWLWKPEESRCKLLDNVVLLWSLVWDPFLVCFPAMGGPTHKPDHSLVSNASSQAFFSRSGPINFYRIVLTGAKLACGRSPRFAAVENGRGMLNLDPSGVPNITSCSSLRPKWIIGSYWFQFFYLISKPNHRLLVAHVYTLQQCRMRVSEVAYKKMGKLYCNGPTVMSL